LSLGELFLIVVFDGVFIGPRAVFALDHVLNTVAYLMTLGIFFSLAGAGLRLQGNPTFQNHWQELLCLNAFTLLAGIVSSMVERGEAKLDALFVALSLVFFSIVGSALAPSIAMLLANRKTRN